LWNVSFAKHVRQCSSLQCRRGTFLRLETHRPRKRSRSSTPSLARCNANGRSGHLLSPRLYRRGGGMWAEYDRVV
jgi:hypothetical protein